ncbi:MAG: hypothetical protein PHQ40_02765 [Anaerolineaceae bacterium]|nr:hypothetical protein [Anaerolineaceae bacterium]
MLSTKYIYRGLITLTIVLISPFLNKVLTVGAYQAVNLHPVYLPLVINNYFKGFSTQDKFIGIDMQQYWTKSSVPTYMSQADNLAGKKHSVSGWFIGIEDGHFVNPPPSLTNNNLYGQLEALWQKGYISFVNINSAATSFAIASGQYDSNLKKMAQTYAAWVSLGGGRRAFLAPLPEMNGVKADGSPWASYGGDPANFKLAYQHIQSIFFQNGVRADQVWWVFAPNGWSIDGHEFEKYYPGDGLVDVVGFSSYNYGFCRVASPWERWENYDTLYAPYLLRISRMAPDKPIIVAQTGTTAQYQGDTDFNINAKNIWLQINYQYLSKQPQVLGILYYDYDQSTRECDWRVTSGGIFSGYRSGAAFPGFRYLSSRDLELIIP